MRTGFLESRPFHLLLLPLYFVIHKFFVLCRPFEAENVGSVSHWSGNFFLALLFALIPGLVIFKSLSVWMKLSKINAAIISTLLVMVFFLESELEFFSQLNSAMLRKRYMLVLGFIAIVLLIRRALNSAKFAAQLNSYLNLLWTALIVYNLVLLVTMFPYVKSPSYMHRDSSFAASCDNCHDIYYILLDAYTSNKSLAKYWRYDNSPFTDSLEDMGFFVADSRTKFIHTYYSMASTLNMSNDSAAINEMHRYDVMRLVKNNIVAQKMKEAGYQIINLSFFDIGNNPAYYKFSNLDGAGDKSILNRFVNNTALRSISNSISESKTYEEHLKVLGELEDVAAAKSNQPRFVYAHLLAPHQPYVMDSSSQQIPLYKLAKSNSKAGYLNQLKGLNKLVLKTVASILRHYDPANPPVIILQGDHGFRYLPDNPEEATTILNAYFFPEHADALYSDISPYNTFRVVFNTYFKSNLRLMEEMPRQSREMKPAIDSRDDVMTNLRTATRPISERE
jgi:hypothetical protein